MGQTSFCEYAKGLLIGAMSVSLAAGPMQVDAQTQPLHASVRHAYQAGEMQGDERILHALNRFTFGPRPGDLEAVKGMGLERWFTQQLHPATIDNSSLDARLAEFPAMRLSTEELLVRLPSGAIIRQTAAGKLPMPGDPGLRPIYKDEIARYQARQERKAEKNEVAAAAVPAGSPMGGHVPGMTADGQGAVQPADGNQMNMAAPEKTPEEPPIAEAEVRGLLAMPPQMRVSELATLPQEELDAFRKALKGPQRAALTADLNPAQREYVEALAGPQRVVIDELAAQRLTRDIYSNTQLQEVMTDFWLNHFNVYLHKNEETPYYLVSYERDVIRPLALGKFEDLLEATAHSPAMLLYLDNSSSMGPDSPAAEKAKIAAARRPNSKKATPEGLNENYARELMELHTLGVNGGYTQADVTEVARVLTGWTVDKPQHGGGFKFDENRHEPGTKKVMGKKIKEHGEQEGRELLHMLATRPATAHFICRKLAVRFVGDEPSQKLVDRMANTFLHSNGDITAVLTTLFHSPEFWAPSDYRAKVKTPLEFVVSAARASNSDIKNMQPLVNALRDMGMPLYGAIPPTGYKWEAEDWVSTGALVNRMNFALQMAANRMQGVTVGWTPRMDAGAANVADEHATPNPAQPAVSAPLPTPETEEQRLEAQLVAGGLSETTRAALLDQFRAQTQGPGTANQSGERMAQIEVKASKPGAMNSAQAQKTEEKQDQLLAGLLLGSPEFQRR